MVDALLAGTTGVTVLIFLFSCIALSTIFIAGNSGVGEGISLSWWTLTIGSTSIDVGDVGCYELRTAMHSGETFGVIFLIASIVATVLTVLRLVRPTTVPRSRVLYAVVYGSLILFSAVQFGSQVHVRAENWCPELFIYNFSSSSYAGGFVLNVLAFLLALGITGLEVFQELRGSPTADASTYTAV